MTGWAVGNLSIGWVLLWTCVAFVVSVIGGVLSGMKLAGKDLGLDLAGLIGALYGPTSAVPAILLALVVVAFR